MTGLTTEQVLFFLYGTGSNGKSVFINTLVGIWGDYAAIAPMETFVETIGERHPTELAKLQGVRLVVAQETEQGRRWSEGKIKALTGGDKITARFMRQAFFEYIPQFKLFIVGNHSKRDGAASCNGQSTDPSNGSASASHRRRRSATQPTNTSPRRTASPAGSSRKVRSGAGSL